VTNELGRCDVVVDNYNAVYGDRGGSCCLVLLGNASLVTPRMLSSCRWKNWKASTSRLPLCLVTSVNSQLSL